MTLGAIALGIGLHLLLFTLPNFPSLARETDLDLGNEPTRLQKREIVADLISDIDNAEIDSARAGELGALIDAVDGLTRYPYHQPTDRGAINVSYSRGQTQFRFEQRHAIYAPAPTLIRWRVTIEPDAVLEFGAAILDTLGRVESGPVEFKVSIEADGARHALYQKRIEPIQREMSELEYKIRLLFLKYYHPTLDEFRDQWSDATIDLDRWRGKTVEIIFETSSEDEKMGHGFFSSPRIYADARADRPNVLLFVLDAGRADSIGAINPSVKGISDNIDSVGESGFVFTNNHAQGNWSRGSFQSMLTGVPWVKLGYRGEWSFAPQERELIYKRAPTPLAEFFKLRGYTTFAVANNNFIYDGALTGMNLGFDRVIDIQMAPYDTIHIVNEFIEEIRRNKNRRFFALVSTNAPHAPFRPPLKYLWKSLPVSDTFHKTLYHAEIAYDDHHFSEFTRALEKLGLADNTIIVIGADHGMNLDRELKTLPSATEDFTDIRFRHGKTLYEEENHTPLIFSGPSIEPGRRSDILTANLDIAPTLAELARFEPDRRWEGISLADILRGQENPDRKSARLKRVVSAGGIKEVFMTIDPSNLKYIRRVEPFDSVVKGAERSPSSIREELFDLSADKDELIDLSLSGPDRLLAARSTFEKYFPKSVTINKATIQGGRRLRDVDLEIETDGEFIFIEPFAPDAEGFTLTRPSPGKIKLTITRLTETPVGLVFETFPEEARVQMRTESKTLDLTSLGGIRIGPSALNSGKKTIEYRPYHDIEYFDRAGIAEESALDEGVYLVSAPFRNWRSRSGSAPSLDRKLQDLMREWGYL